MCLGWREDTYRSGVLAWGPLHSWIWFSSEEQGEKTKQKKSFKIFVYNYFMYMCYIACDNSSLCGSKKEKLIKSTCSEYSLMVMNRDMDLRDNFYFWCNVNNVICKIAKIKWSTLCPSFLWMLIILVEQVAQCDIINLATLILQLG